MAGVTVTKGSATSLVDLLHVPWDFIPLQKAHLAHAHHTLVPASNSLDMHAFARAGDWQRCRLDQKSNWAA